MKKLVMEGAIVALLLVSTSQMAMALPIGTAAHVEASAMTAGMSTTAAADAAKVGAWLQREDVQAQLMARGVSVQEAQARVAALGERDLARLGTTIDAMPAGSGALAIAGIVLVVMLILELLGVTDLFKSM